MKITTLCYLEKDNSYLMLKRDKKKNDPNQNKYIGVGGKKEINESIIDCLHREVYEETGLKLNEYQYHGIIYFNSDIFEQEEMHLFTSNNFTGLLKYTVEGSFHWINKDQVLNLDLWTGDPIFLKAIFEDKPFFTLHLFYEKDTLKSFYFEEDKHE